MRKAIPYFLSILLVVTVLLSSVAVWANKQVTNTDYFVKTVASLADDPVVQAEVSERMTQTIVAAVDIDGRLGAYLPGQLDFLAEKSITYPLLNRQNDRNSLVKNANILQPVEPLRLI